MSRGPEIGREIQIGEEGRGRKGSVMTGHSFREFQAKSEGEFLNFLCGTTLQRSSPVSQSTRCRRQLIIDSPRLDMLHQLARQLVLVDHAQGEHIRPEEERAVLRKREVVEFVGFGQIGV